MLGRLSHVPIVDWVEGRKRPARRHGTALAAARKLRPRGRLIGVVGGCGGDRDKEKRPGMGAEIARADAPIFTSDNPRSEDPQAIIDGLLSGVFAERRTHVGVELDRTRAIDVAARSAHPGDVVLVVGKGHETSQEIAGAKCPWDDAATLRAALQPRLTPILA